MILSHKKIIQGYLDSYTQPEPDTWAWDKVNSELGDAEDQRYHAMKDDR